MLRKIIRIDESKCDGCGACVPACKEGALQVIDGKARLVSDVYCDGLGACLGDCPRGAIEIIEREAPAFDLEAAERHVAQLQAKKQAPAAHGGCPGSAHRTLATAPASGPHAHHAGGGCPGSAHRMLNAAGKPARPGPSTAAGPSQLGHWPVQLQLVSPRAPFLQGADLLVCADCVPFAVPDFHQRYLAGRAVVVGCPKLDDIEHYREKLAAIVYHAQPKSLTVLRMEVPCCGGIAQALVAARDVAAPELPVELHTIGVDGSISVQKLGPDAGEG
ncbi:MAG: ATP-binding protein [Myxococcales bacterium]|jgi:NAD-dependent dihydropyrimidine dehydrogenase PreA subunit